METVLLPRPTQPLHIVNQPIIKEVCPLTIAVKRELASCGYKVLSAIDVDVEDRVVRLNGCVQSFYLKQVAQTCVRRVETQVRIANDLEVVYPGSNDNLPDLAHPS
jgi:hypothetical protein